jgi:Protein of unknown function (DUF3617)
MKNCWLECLLAVVVLVSIPCKLSAQLAGMPIKPGLWESTVTMDMGMPGGAKPMTRQVCYSASMTMDQYMNQLLKQTPGIQCTMSNRIATAHGVTLDQTCVGTVAGGTMKTSGHIVLEFPDSEHVSAKTHSTMSGTMQGKPMDMTMDMTSSAKFISSDCGNVKPLVMPPAK